VAATATPTPDPSWMPRGACVGAPRDLFVTDPEGTDNLDPAAGPVDDEDWVPPAAALAYCQRCRVLPECLDWALTFDEWGTWAATSRHQRRQLARVRSRRGCPACGGTGIAVVDTYELCLTCGVSWRAKATTETGLPS
jgi:hypothetical protein